MGLTRLEQSIHFAQGILAAASRSKAIAVLQELHVEDRFNHPFDGHLDNPVLDRRDPQWPGLPMALGISTRLTAAGTVGALPQIVPQLLRVAVCLSGKPSHAHPIHPRHAPVGFYFLPSQL